MNGGTVLCTLFDGLSILVAQRAAVGLAVGTVTIIELPTLPYFSWFAGGTRYMCMLWICMSR